ncbi:transposase [Lonsdalea quercina]
MASICEPGASVSIPAKRIVKDVCREAGISEASYYNWKAKFGGIR